MKTVELLWGLPGSGKTYYAEGKKNCVIIDLDKLIKKQNFLEILIKRVKKSKKDVVIDGLITTNEFAEKILKEIKNCKIKIIFWEEDRESCLFNDKGRRKLNSETSIKNLPLEVPENGLLKRYSAKLVKMRVVRKPEHIVWLQEKGVSELKSERWCLGGTYGSCYGHSGVIEPSDQLISFREFDDFLLGICPDLSFLKYKKLYNETVSVETEWEGDYYGGNVSYARYVCDLSKLYYLLKELNLT